MGLHDTRVVVILYCALRYVIPILGYKSQTITNACQSLAFKIYVTNDTDWLHLASRGLSTRSMSSYKHGMLPNDASRLLWHAYAHCTDN